MPKLRPPTHPGDVLLEDFMRPMGLSIDALAASLRLPAGLIAAIVAGNRAVTADTAARLGRYFDTSAALWTNLQAKFDRLTAEDHPRRMAARRS
jgi:addiction module HigA family antidote